MQKTSRVLLVCLLGYSLNTHSSFPDLSAEQKAHLSAQEVYLMERVFTTLTSCNASSTKNILATCLVNGALEIVKEGFNSPEVQQELQSDAATPLVKDFMSKSAATVEDVIKATEEQLAQTTNETEKTVLETRLALSRALIAELNVSLAKFAIIEEAPQAVAEDQAPISHDEINNSESNN